MQPFSDPYYRRDLATVHHRGFSFHAEACAPGILRLLEPVLEQGGLVLEIGCGSGLLTTELIGAGHRVVATDASPAMLHLARSTCPDGTDLRLLTLPFDDVPVADAVVGVGHALNYLADESAVEQALRSMARAIRPGGILAVDICDLEWGSARTAMDSSGRVGDDWAIVTRYASPRPERYVRDLTTFLRNEDGTWRRDDERHDNVLIDTGRLPALLAAEGVDAEVRSSFGTEQLPIGLRALVGNRVTDRHGAAGEARR
ncbi:MAG TPA: class I SAM-dependent methyltransferase [Acidimicrobiales bacterium]|jgi:SAM-dependent methyltransferase|nr:class I SAM-dependent methyltransferase [Acidimicrobiales bacterium]